MKMFGFILSLLTIEEFCENESTVEQLNGSIGFVPLLKNRMWRRYEIMHSISHSLPM